MTKTSTFWLVGVIFGILGLSIFGCVIFGMIAGRRDARYNELIGYKKVTNYKCKNCSQVVAVDTAEAKMKQGDLDGRQFVTVDRDTICGSCKIKQVQKAEKFLKEGKRAFGNKDYETALDRFYSAEALGNDEAVKWRKRTDDILNEMARSLSRADYALILREHFLDKNMDVKVWITGKDNKYLHMKFVLFNDVWVHNFKEGDLVQEIRKLEFDRVYFTDGFGYNTYIYW